MKKTFKIISIFSLLPLAIIPAYIGSTTDLDMVEAWAFFMTIIMMVCGTVGGLTSLDSR